MNRPHVNRAIWYCAAERWSAAGERRELPIMWSKVSRWWPWHPALVVATLATVGLVVLSVVVR